MLKTAEIFNKNAAFGANFIDELISTGKYKRGKLFRKIVSENVKNGSLVLDYGCGTGRMTKFISEGGYRFEGYEPAINSYKEAKKIEDENLRFFHLNDFGDCLTVAKYDAVVCSSVIEFVELPDKVLQNFYRSLKANGILIISFSNRSSLWKKYYYLRFGKKAGHHMYQQNSWNNSEFIDLLESNGFKSISKTIFFESAFDKFLGTKQLSRLSFFGTLGVVVAKKV